MNYKNYLVTRDLTWNLLIEQNITRLPISVNQICKNLSIPIKLYNAQDDNDGYSTLIKGKPAIFVNCNISTERQRFTAAHELGHVLLGHVGLYQLVNREPSLDDNSIEQQANVFASRLLAPACVLWGCNVQKAEDIEKLCCISHESAKFRMERLNTLYNRNKFLCSPLECKVYNQFENYINSHLL